MNLQQALEQLNTLETTMYAYNFALGTISTDAATAAPKGAAECRGKAMSILSGARHQIFANEETEKLLLFLTEHKDELDLVTRRRVEELDLDYKRLSLIPLDEYMAYSELQNKADAVWQEAKGKNDFELFRPVLEELFSYNKRFAGYYDASKAPYDALLDMYERGTTMEMLDGFFAELRKTIVPLLKEIQSKPEINNDFLFQHFPIEQQKKFTDYLMDVINIDKNHCAVSETEHPFTNGSSKYDVRVTTHYYEDNVASNMYSIIHEGGHALYELHIADELMYTILGGGVSTGIHESQSRFYENIIGRSFAFIKYIYPKVQELFPEQFHDISAEDFYKAVNKPEASLIRTEADELTYCLHIMVRYEIEKQLLAGTLEVKDIPSEWNRLYKEYLGVDVPNDAQGCLQDCHWSMGLIGYFPSYALGTAYGAQMLAKMQEEFDVFGQVEQGDISNIENWLIENIQKHGGLYKPVELLEKAFGGFDPKYYTEYLKDKFTALYNL